MPKLFVDKSTDIHASAQRVWDVLTRQEYTLDWATEFSGGSPKLYIDSDWSLGSAVQWKDPRGHVMVEGNVTAVEPHGLLRFTVFDVESERPAVTPEDGITFKLTDRDGKTTLWVSQGDFSSMQDGQKYRDLSDAIWDRVLVKIRALAEGRGSVP